MNSAIFFFTLSLLIFLFSAIGFLFVNKKLSLIVAPQVGFGVILIVINYLYFVFNISSFYVGILVILLIFIIFIFFIKKDKFFKVYKKILKITIIPQIFFTLLIYFYGEQFYVFRGNWWDAFGYVSGGYYNFFYTNNELIKYYSILNNVNFYSDIEITGLGWSKGFPQVSLILGIVFNIKFINFFLAFTLIKVLDLLLLSLTFFLIFSKIVKKIFYLNVLLSLCFVFSFWTIYIFEIDALRHLTSFSFFLLAIFLIEDFIMAIKNKNYNFILIYTIILSGVFSIYIELGFIYLLFALFFIIIKKEFRIIIKNYKELIFSIFFLIIFLLPIIDRIVISYLDILSSLQVEPRWWTYFGKFLTGKNSPILFDENFVNYISKDIFPGVTLKSLIISIFSAIKKYNYEYIYFNFIPSYFGFYFLTDLFIFKNLKFLNLLFLIFLNLYLIFIIYNNILNIFKKKSKKLYLYKTLIIFFIIFNFFLLINGKLWTSIKLYTYFFPILILIVFFNFRLINNKIYITINYALVLVMFIFPIYKYSTFNHGITRHDSFPSVQVKESKINTKWVFNIKEYEKCDFISLDFKEFNYKNPESTIDYFKAMYVSIKLLEYNFTLISKNIFKNKILFNNTYEQHCIINNV